MHLRSLSSYRFILVLVAGALLCGAPALHSQGSLGSVSGRITDPQGLGTPGVTVTLTNTATAQEKSTTTNEEGYYTFAALPPNTYQIRTSAPGFRPTLTSAITLAVSQTLTNDITLLVGSVDSTVNVEAAAPLIQRETSSTGQVITSQQILEFPLVSRNFFNLSLLVPGASENPGAQSQFSINGARGNQTSILLDGIDARLFQNGRPAFTPSVDAVQEFKIQQNANSAAYGDGAAIINATTRSGTNGFHGVLFEFIRNNALNAKGYFSKTAPVLRRNNFGASAGGPIWRRHTFFFGNYEGLRTRSTATQFALIPTPAQLGGNFSGSATIYDPFNLDPFGQRIPFQGNIIPAARISQIGRAAAALYPAPNLTGVPGYNYALPEANPDDANQYTVRVDHQISASDSLFARYSSSNESILSYNYPLPYSGTINRTGGKQALLHETHIFNANLLNDFAVGWTYGLFLNDLITANHDVATQDFGLTNLKIPPYEYGAPLLNVTGYSSMGSPLNNPNGGFENNYQLDDDMTWIRGNHSLRAGIEVRQYRPAQYASGIPSGSLTFDGRFTGKNSSNIGNPVADLVLGAPYTATATQFITSNGLVTLRWNQYQGYLQDDWKATPKLTVNLGLRYVYAVPYREVHGLAYVWDRNSNTFLIPGQTTDGLLKPDRNNLAPRFGVAYSLTPSLVLRAGAGVYYGFIRGAELSSGYGLNAPFLASTTVNSSTASPTLPVGLFSAASPNVTPTTNIFSVERNLPDNYTYQYNLTVQSQVTPTLAVQASYVGSSAHKLTGRDLINQARQDPNPAASTSIQSRRPFQGAADISITRAVDQANYNALQVSAEKRASHGISLLAAYTWSKALGVAEAGDQSAIGNEYVPRGTYYGPTVYSQPQRLTLSPVVDLPFGRHRAFGASLPRAVDAVVGGWTVTAIGTFFSGEFVSPTSNVSANVGRVDRNFPNCLHNPNLSSGQRSITRWFDTTAIVSQPFGTFGNCHTGVIQVPGENNVDFSGIKNIVFHDRFRAEFRSEFFNLFNHPSFGQPNTQVGSASFGVISTTRTNSRQIQFGLKLYW